LKPGSEPADWSTILKKPFPTLFRTEWILLRRLPSNPLLLRIFHGVGRKSPERPRPLLRECCECSFQNRLLHKRNQHIDISGITVRCYQSALLPARHPQIHPPSKTEPMA